jgi:hypothetical protein
MRWVILIAIILFIVFVAELNNEGNERMLCEMIDGALSERNLCEY